MRPLKLECTDQRGISTKMIVPRFIRKKDTFINKIYIFIESKF